MKYTNSNQHTLKSQLRLPVSCKHKIYGSGKVVDVKISNYNNDLILVCQFGTSKIRFLYSKTSNAVLQLPISQRILYDRLVDTLDDRSVTLKTANTSVVANKDLPDVTETTEVLEEASIEPTTDTVEETRIYSNKTKNKKSRNQEAVAQPETALDETAVEEQFSSVEEVSEAVEVIAEESVPEELSTNAD